MSRKTTFTEFNEVTQKKHASIAKKCAALAFRKSDGDKSKVWFKDEVLGHIEEVFLKTGKEFSERLADTYLERMRLASVRSGPEEPTLDLVPMQAKGFGYKWIRDGSIPAGFLKHVLSIGRGMLRISWDYFMLLARGGYGLTELIYAINPTNAMSLLLNAELYIRVHRVDDFTPKELEMYLELISQFKEEVQSKVTRAEREGFNAMAEGILLTG